MYTEERLKAEIFKDIIVKEWEIHFYKLIAYNVLYRAHCLIYRLLCT